MFDGWQSLVLYSRAIVNVWGASTTRRWQSAMAIVAGLSLFAAVTTGWAARGSLLAGAALPQSAALSQETLHVGVNAGHVRVDHQSQLISHVAYGFSSGSSQTPQKPTKNAWMTRDRPPTWARLSPQSLRSPLPASFAALGFQPGRAQSRAPAAVCADQDILTELCVARR